MAELPKEIVMRVQHEAGEPREWGVRLETLEAENVELKRRLSEVEARVSERPLAEGPKGAPTWLRDFFGFMGYSPDSGEWILPPERSDVQPPAPTEPAPSVRDEQEAQSGEALLDEFEDAVRGLDNECRCGACDYCEDFPSSLAEARESYATARAALLTALRSAQQSPSPVQQEPVAWGVEIEGKIDVVRSSPTAAHRYMDTLDEPTAHIVPLYHYAGAPSVQEEKSEQSRGRERAMEVARAAIRDVLKPTTGRWASEDIEVAAAELVDEMVVALRPASAAQKLADEILAELERARAKFPGDNVTTLALVEEVGELAKATFEESRERVRKEAVQVATMAMRVVLDGDSTLDRWRAAKGLDPLAPASAVPREQEEQEQAGERERLVDRIEAAIREETRYAEAMRDRGMHVPYDARSYAERLATRVLRSPVSPGAAPEPTTPERHPDCPYETGECRWPECVPCAAPDAGEQP